MRVTRAADAGPAEVRQWIAEPYIPAQEVSLLTGGRRAGKGLVAIHIVAAASQGQRVPWDLAQGEPLVAHNIIWIIAGSGEDRSSEICARFRAAGGAVERFMVLALDEGDKVDSLRPHLQRPTLIVADPLQALIGDLTHPRARGRMEELVSLARSTGSTVLGIRHLTKAGQGRGRGEIADVVRSELVIGKHPSDESLTCVVQERSSYGEGEPIAFRLDTSGSTPVLAHLAGDWDDDIHPVDLIPRPPKRRPTARLTKRQRTQRWLMDLLAARSLPRVEVLRLGRRRRLSPSTIERAARDLGINSESSRNGGQFGGAVWSLPFVDPAPEEPQEPGSNPPEPSRGPEGPAEGDAPVLPTDSAARSSERQPTSPRQFRASCRGREIEVDPSVERIRQVALDLGDPTPAQESDQDDDGPDPQVERFRRLMID